jgi:hypothetical protein
MGYSSPTPKPLSMCITSAGIVRWKARLKKVPGLLLLVRLCRIIIDPGYRSEWLLKRNRPYNLFQPNSETWHNRFPGKKLLRSGTTFGHCRSLPFVIRMLDRGGGICLPIHPLSPIINPCLKTTDHLNQRLAVCVQRFDCSIRIYLSYKR